MPPLFIGMSILAELLFWQAFIFVKSTLDSLLSDIGLTLEFFAKQRYQWHCQENDRQHGECCR